jgi:hypothetical protein
MAPVIFILFKYTIHKLDGEQYPLPDLGVQ